MDGGPYAGVSVFDGEPVENAPGWSVSKVTTELAGHGRWRIMRFRRADAEIGSGTTALVVGLRDGIATTFPSDLPFVWNVAPTSEGWGCGYAINGPFKLDPGRTHVSLDDEATLRVVDLLGEALGKGLVDLYDALVGTSETSAASVLHGGDAQRFVASLWRVLSSGLDTPDDLRRMILLRLHGTDRGVSAWMSARSVVPTGLPAPFAERLPALKAGMRMEVAAGGLGDPDLCRALAMIADATLVRSDAACRRGHGSQSRYG